MLSRRGFLAAGAMLAGGGRLVKAAEELTSYRKENVQAWFDKTYFNLIVDYYTEVPERPYGTGFTRDNLLASLKLARPGFILYYAKGHSGTTAFKSRLGTEHPKLGDDPLKVLRDATREAGVRFGLYYSGLVDGKAGQKHPEWQACGWDGKPYGGGPPFYMIPICPASPYFEEWVAVHLEEMMTRYDPDLIWVDGDWAGGGYCLCERCKKLARDKFGEGAIQRPKAWPRTGRTHCRRSVRGVVQMGPSDHVATHARVAPARAAGPVVLVRRPDERRGEPSHARRRAFHPFHQYQSRSGYVADGGDELACVRHSHAGAVPRERALCAQARGGPPGAWGATHRRRVEPRLLEPLAAAA